MDRKSLPSGGKKVFPKKEFSTNSNRFPLVEKMKRLTKRKRFPQDRNWSPQYVMKNSLINTFPLDEGLLSVARKSKKRKKNNFQ